MAIWIAAAVAAVVLALVVTTHKDGPKQPPYDICQDNTTTACEGKEE